MYATWRDAENADEVYDRYARRISDDVKRLWVRMLKAGMTEVEIREEIEDALEMCEEYVEADGSYSV